MLIYHSHPWRSHEIEDTDDGVISKVSDEELIEAISSGLAIQNIYVDGRGNIVDGFGFLVVEKAFKPVGGSLHKTRSDEAYTHLSDIVCEMSHYPRDTFRGKVVYCPCDVAVSDGSVPKSNFVKYFQNNCKSLGIKKLICTSLCSLPGFYECTGSMERNYYILERLDSGETRSLGVAVMRTQVMRVATLTLISVRTC